MTGGSDQLIFLCRRWDRLGGRLMALTNTVALARSFECGFGFMWPEGPDPIGDPTPLLSRTFLERYTLSEEDLRGHTVLPEGEIIYRDRAGVRARVAEIGEQVFVEIQNPFAIVHPRDDDESEAGKRFTEAFYSIDWSDDARRLVDFASAWNTDEATSALHVRGGDIVSGRWRHTMYYGKYMPTPYVTYAAEELSRRSGHLLALSDNEMLLAWLRGRFDSIATAADIVPEYDRLPDVLRAFADILLLSRCSAVYGPSDSAFSTLAAHLGGRRVLPADRLVPPGEAGDILSAGIRRTEADLATAPFLRPFLARDIDWYLDVFGDGVPLEEQHRLARRAVALDPDSICITGRLAHLAALHGDRREAADAAASVVRLSRDVEGIPETVVESLATQVTVECFELVLGRRHRGLFQALRRRPTPEQRRATLNGALHGLRRSVQRIRETQSYEFDARAIAENLQELVAMVEWLSTADDELFTLLDGRGGSWNGTAVDMRAFRAPTPAQNLGDGDGAFFPWVVRIFERAAVHLSQGLGSLMTPVREDPTAPMRGGVDEVTESDTGVQWLWGWVTETMEHEGRLAGGLALVTSADFAGAAATNFTLPDFDDIVGPTAGGTVAFRMPVPRGLGPVTDDARAFRILGVARDGRECTLRAEGHEPG